MLKAAGLVRGDRVALLGVNSPDLLECMMGVWWAGGVIVALNTRLSSEELQVIIRHAEAKIVITDLAQADIGLEVQKSCSSVSRLLHFGTDWQLPCRKADPHIARPDELAALFYTGGTTGVPKGVELTHANFVFMGLTVHRELEHNSRTVYLHIPPLYHLADFSTALGVIFGCGAHSFMPQFRLDEFYRRLEEDGVTHLQLVPTMLEMILAAPAEQRRLLRQIRSIGYGAAPIGEPLLHRLIEDIPHAKIHQFYGMTESAGASAILPPERHVLEGPLAGKLRSAGQPTPGTEMRIVDGDLNELPIGQSGEILVRNPGVMRGYFKDTKRTAETIVDGWLRSGDIGRLDEEGFLFVHDRLKDMIISGGENVYCGEVENVLLHHPAVQSCAVLGIPDDRWGERVHAAVILKTGAAPSEKELDRHCRSLIAAYKVPRSYEFRTTPLPLSTVGKVNKQMLREEWRRQLQSGGADNERDR
jgi:long-chain acyl-CoA synthetase